VKERRSRKQWEYEDRLILTRVSALLGHLKGCRLCSGAVRCGMWGEFCAQGVELSAKLAVGFEVMTELKRVAGPDHMGQVYACPDLSRHGMSYGECAELLTVLGSQEMLF
jgi:hypothetical protein